MKTLTKEQIELLKNEDVKAIASKYADYCFYKSVISKNEFDSFASQFTVEPELERKLRFVTNDNYIVYEGDTTKIYCVTPKYIIGEDYADRLNGMSLIAYFKSKEKATEYVLLNSPKLSVNNLIDIYDSVDQPVKLIHRDEFIYRANQFVKSKQC